MDGRELLEMLREVETILVKVYDQDGNPVCFDVKVGVAEAMMAVDKMKEKEK